MFQSTSVDLRFCQSFPCQHLSAILTEGGRYAFDITIESVEGKVSRVTINVYRHGSVYYILQAILCESRLRLIISCV